MLTICAAKRDATSSAIKRDATISVNFSNAISSSAITTCRASGSLDDSDSPHLVFIFERGTCKNGLHLAPSSHSCIIEPESEMYCIDDHGTKLNWRPTRPTQHDAPAKVASPKFEIGPGPYNLDLDAASGEYEERFLQAPAAAFTVKGFVQFITARASAMWAPMAGIELVGPKDSYSFGLIAFVEPKAPDEIEFAVREEGLEGGPNTSFARVHRGDLAIPFELRLDRSGVLEVSAAGKPGTAISIGPLEITRVRVLASTGHMRFSNVEVVASDR